MRDKAYAPPSDYITSVLGPERVYSAALARYKAYNAWFKSLTQEQQ
jgi:hypothetical protein